MYTAFRVIGMVLGTIIFVPLVLIACCIMIPLIILHLLGLLFLGYIQWSFEGKSEILDEFSNYIRMTKCYFGG